MNPRELTSDALIGVVIGFAPSGLFYVIWGVVLGAVAVRLAIFVFFGGF